MKTLTNVFDKVTFWQTDHCPGLRAVGPVVYTNCAELGILFLIPARNDKHIKIKLNYFFME